MVVVVLLCVWVVSYSCPVPLPCAHRPLKRAEPNVDEKKTLMRALRDTNLAKLSKDDVDIFLNLIQVRRSS